MSRSHIGGGNGGGRLMNRGQAKVNTRPTEGEKIPDYAYIYQVSVVAGEIIECVDLTVASKRGSGNPSNLDKELGRLAVACSTEGNGTFFVQKDDYQGTFLNQGADQESDAGAESNEGAKEKQSSMIVYMHQGRIISSQNVGSSTRIIPEETLKANAQAVVAGLGNEKFSGVYRISHEMYEKLQADESEHFQRVREVVYTKKEGVKIGDPILLQGYHSAKVIQKNVAKLTGLLQIDPKNSNKQSTRFFVADVDIPDGDSIMIME